MRPRDIGHEETELLLKRLEKRIAEEYTVATKEVEAKFTDYMRRFEIKDKIKREAVEAGVLKQDEYIQWRTSQVMVGKRWQTMLNDLAEDLHYTNEIALETAYSYTPEIYAINHNWETFLIEGQSQVNTGYTLYSRQTVERLMRDDPKLLPDPRPGSKTARMLAENKDLRWNRQKLSSAITQGILQGDPVPQITKRLESVAEMDHRAAIRNARTMATGAQNAGRIDAGKRANSMGIGLTNVWMATLDMRTRHEHRLLDGQRREVGEPFVVPDTKEEIMYPGDPNAEPYLVYNCRCTLIPQVKGFEYDVRSDDRTDYSGIEGMTYDEWKANRTEKPTRITRPEERQTEAKGEYINEYETLRKKTLEIVGNNGTIEETTNAEDTVVQEVRATYGRGMAMEYDSIPSGDTVELYQIPYNSANDPTYVPTREQIGTFLCPENKSESVAVYRLPDEAMRMAYDDSRAAILSGGRVVLPNREFRSGKMDYAESMVTNEVYALAGVRRQGVFYRVMGSDKEAEYIKRGTIRASINHMTGESEGGLSVWETPKYGGGRVAIVTGDIIGIGSDGEPVLDISTIRFVGIYDDDVEHISVGVTRFAKLYGWTEKQVRDAMKRRFSFIM